MASPPPKRSVSVSVVIVLVVAVSLVAAGVSFLVGLRMGAEFVRREVERRATPVDLPRASTGEDITTTLALTLTRDGELYLDGRRATEDEVNEAIASARRGDREVRAVVAADREVSHSRVRATIDLIRKAGVSRFALNVEGADDTEAAGPPDSGRP